MLYLVITLVSHNRCLRIQFQLRHHNHPCFKGQNCCHKSLTSMIDECIRVLMVQLVITLVSHTRGLRFESGFRHHNIVDRKGQNNFHNSITSMFDESSDVQQLLIRLVSNSRHLPFMSRFKNHNFSGHTLEVSELNPNSDIRIVFTNH